MNTLAREIIIFAAKLFAERTLAKLSKKHLNAVKFRLLPLRFTPLYADTRMCLSKNGAEFSL